MTFKSRKTICTHFTSGGCNKLPADSQFYLRSTRKKRLKTGSTTHECTICGSLLCSKTALKRHFFKHADLSFPTTDIESTASIYTRDAAGDFVCTECKAVVKDKRAMHRHHISQHGTKMKCKLCDRQFESSKTFNTHMQKEHGMLKQEEKKPAIFACEVCAKPFKSRFNLKVHSYIHTDERPHLCKWCGLGFKAVSSLRSHEMRHVAIKPFKCTLCPNGYYTQKDLTAHVRVHTGTRFYLA